MNTGLMILLIFVFTVIAVILLWVVAALSYRALFLRRRGSTVVMRRITAADDRPWRHGVVVYGDTEMRFFRLASLRMRADRALGRHEIEIGARREPEADEIEVLGTGMHIARLDVREGSYELALGPDAMTACQAWLESRPPEHMVRTRGREARRRGWTER